MMRTRDGYTLVELVVVLALVGVLAAVVAPALPRAMPPGDPLDAASDSVATLLARARRTAVERGSPIDLIIAPGARRWWLRGAALDTGGVVALDAGVTFAAALQERLQLHFDPRGPISAPPIALRQGRRSRTVRMDPWTGVAHVEGRGDARAR